MKRLDGLVAGIVAGTLAISFIIGGGYAYTRCLFDQGYSMKDVENISRESDPLDRAILNKPIIRWAHHDYNKKQNKEKQKVVEDL